MAPVATPAIASTSPNFSRITRQISLLHEVLSPKGFNASQIRDIYRSLSSSQSGKRFFTTEWEVLRDREYLWIQKKDSSPLIPELIIEEIERTPSFVIPRDKHIACLDADKLNHPLTIRKWERGDKFIPLGMNGKKKVSDSGTNWLESFF